MRDRLSHRHLGRQHRKSCAYIGHHRFAAAQTRLQVDIDFGRMNPLGMLVKFGASGAPSYLHHLGHLTDQQFSQTAQAIRFIQRSAGIEHHAQHQ